MLLCRVCFLLLCTLPLSIVTTAAVGFDSCLAESAPTERARCLESYLSDHPLTDADLERLQRLVVQDPEAAALFRAALAKVDGTTRLSWFREEGGAAWSLGIDLGDSRLERAAEALLAAGRAEEARPLLERALSLGADGWAVEAWKQTGAGPVVGLDPAPSPLLAPPWFRRLPELQVSMLDGGSFDLSSARGSVLILDFWATWCAPCREELPHLQQLYTEFREHGLLALTINAEEPDELVRDFAEQLGLTLPIGRYDRRMERAFRVRALPTLILADRQGRIRNRWDGYTVGLERQVAKMARRLLAGDDPEGEPRKVAEVLAGGGLLRAEWRVQGPSSIDGMVLAPALNGPMRIFLTRKGELATVDRTGSVLDRIDAPASAGRLRQADLDGDGHVEFVSFRPGGREILVFDRLRGTHLTWSAPSYVLDLALLAAGTNNGASGEVWLATVDGLSRADPLGKQIRKVGGTVEIAAVTVVGSGASARILALTTDGRLQRFNPAGQLLDQWTVPKWSWSLVSAAAGGGWGVVPSSVKAWAVGRFLPGEGYQAAVATDSSQLVLVDLTRGEVGFRARWQGIRELAAGDLDADGRDELLVAAGGALCLLSAASVPATSISN